MTLHHFGLISRHGLPQTSGYYILHEGLIGVFGDKGLQEVGYSAIETAKTQSFRAAAPGSASPTSTGPPRSSRTRGSRPTRASSSSSRARPSPSRPTSSPAVTVAPGATTETTTRLFAGAKEVRLVDGYADRLKIDRFDRLIDWGWFYFITKPLFVVMDWIFHPDRQFRHRHPAGDAAHQGPVLPARQQELRLHHHDEEGAAEMMEIRDRYAEDKMKQQQELMALYKREKINPLAGCWPIMIQIPVFFALYKVLFITIEMRHAPFFGWIQDLSAPDPTSIFNLFGLLPFSVPAFLLIGVWPIIMGITMWIQMQMNPARRTRSRPRSSSGCRSSSPSCWRRSRPASSSTGPGTTPVGAPAGPDHAQVRREDRTVGQHALDVRRRAGQAAA